MRKASSGDYLLYYLAKALAGFFRSLPVSIGFFIGRRVGELFAIFNRKRYKIAYANLKAAFGSKYSPKELKRILKRTYANIGQGAVEVFLLPKLDDRYIKKYIKFENFHFAEEALKKGKGFIFLTAHFGTWEISHSALPSIGFAFKPITREQKPYLVNELLNSFRESKGCKILMKGPAVREAIRTLRSNGIVGMIADQDAGKSGIFIKFFNRMASSPRGVMEIALKTGAAIIPGFAIRENGPYVTIKCFKPIELTERGSKEETIKGGFRQYASILEKLIEEYPDQWLWQHRRWKSSPNRDIIILNDGRTGHLRQSEAVLKKIEEIWQKKGYLAEDIRSRVIDLKCRKGLCGQLLNLGSNLCHSYCQGCMNCLRFCLKSDDYSSLMANYGDIIISCGSSIAPVNLLLSRENNAKSIVIMKPPLISLKKFDLAIIAKHDNPPKRENVVVTEGALNVVEKQHLERCINKAVDRIGSLRDRVIGLLIGGNTKDSYIDKASISSLLDSLIKVAKERDCDILLTTSRRTSKEAEDLIKAKLNDMDRCKLLVIANEANMEGAVEAILGLSDIVLVSEDSISMVSEAASSDNYTIVFRQSGRSDKKHQKFLRNLSHNNFIDIVDMENIYTTVLGIFDDKPEQRVLDDSSKIEGPLERLL